MCCRGWRGNRRGTRRRSSLHSSLSLFPLEDGLQGVARLGHLGEVELRLGLRSLSARTCTPVSTVEIVAHLFGLVGFNGAGMRLPSNPDRLQSVQNWPALYFQFPCQIVDSNFAHPSLFTSLRP
jgi:hypothetical protein